MPSTWCQETFIRALRYAAEAHHGQTVPGAGLPYVVHVAMVAMEVIAALAHEDHLDGDLAIQCALLHDVIEDTGKTHDEIATVFKKDGFQSNQEKMADSLARIKQQPKEVWMVKLADRITNFQPPPSYWSAQKIDRYREEGRVILEHLGQGSPYLAERLRQKMIAYKRNRNG